MSLEEQFKQVADAVRNWKTKPADDENFALYSLYKQATLGDVNIPEPSSGLAEIEKFKAWTNRKGISHDDAKKLYIELAQKLSLSLSRTATATATASARTTATASATATATSSSLDMVTATARATAMTSNGHRATAIATATARGSATATATASVSAPGRATKTQFDEAAVDVKELKSLPWDSDLLELDDMFDFKGKAKLEALTKK